MHVKAPRPCMVVAAPWYRGGAVIICNGAPRPYTGAAPLLPCTGAVTMQGRRGQVTAPRLFDDAMAMSWCGHTIVRDFLPGAAMRRRNSHVTTTVDIQGWRSHTSALWLINSDDAAAMQRHHVHVCTAHVSVSRPCSGTTAKWRHRGTVVYYQRSDRVITVPRSVTVLWAYNGPAGIYHITALWLCSDGTAM